VLLAIRQLGNKLNANDDDGNSGGGPRGPPGSASKGGGGSIVVAFRLESLLKLSHTKAFNAKTTVLHFLVSQLARRDADCLRLAEELPDAAPASRLSLDAVRADVSALKQGLGAVEKLVREQAKLEGGWGRLRGGSAVASAIGTPPPLAERSGSAGLGSGGGDASSSVLLASAGARKRSSASPDALISAIAAAADESLGSTGLPLQQQQQQRGQSLADFVGCAQQQLEALQAGVDACRSGFSAVLEYLAEDPGMAVDAFFSILSAFLAALRRAQTENAEDEARRARELRRQSSRAVIAPQPLSASGPPETPGSSTPLVAATPSITQREPAAGDSAEPHGIGKVASMLMPAPSSVVTAVPAEQQQQQQVGPPGRPGIAALLAGKSLLRKGPSAAGAPPPAAAPPSAPLQPASLATDPSSGASAPEIRRLEF
jgi:hypothetical protein